MGTFFKNAKTVNLLQTENPQLPFVNRLLKNKNHFLISRDFFVRMVLMIGGSEKYPNYDPMSHFRSKPEVIVEKWFTPHSTILMKI